MRVHLTRAVVIFCFSSLLVAQQQPQYFTPVAGAGQNLHGQASANEGAFGIITNKTAEGFIVAAVAAGGPAEKSGLRQGDLIRKVNGKPASDLSQADFNTELKKKPGDSLQLVVEKAGQESTAELTSELRSKVYPQEAKMPPSIRQFILDGHASITAALAQDNPQRVFLWLLVSNLDGPSLTLDDAKFFVLDGQRQQLHHVTLPEIQYSIQTAVAQNMHSGPYTPPPPPSPQRQYTVNSTENGNYLLNSLGGGVTTISGTSASVVRRK